MTFKINLLSQNHRNLSDLFFRWRISDYYLGEQHLLQLRRLKKCNSVFQSLPLYSTNCFEMIPISVDAFYQFHFLILNTFDSTCTSFIAALFWKVDSFIHLTLFFWHDSKISMSFTWGLQGAKLLLTHLPSEKSCCQHQLVFRNICWVWCLVYLIFFSLS